MKKLLSLVVLFLGVQAHAGLIVEPFLGYDSGSVQSTTTAGASATSTNSGFSYGARLGYRFGQAFWMAAEYAGGSGTNKAGTSESNYSKTAMSAVFGYKFGKYNVWAGYGISDKLTYAGTPEIYVSGTNMKLGFNYETANHVAVGVEYIIPKYTKFGDGTTELNISDSFSKYEVPCARFVVVFPFDLSK